MALEAVVFSQDPFGFTNWDSSSSSIEMMKSPLLLPLSWDSSSCSLMALQNNVSNNELWDPNNSSPESCNFDHHRHHNQVEFSLSPTVEEVEPSTGGTTLAASGGGARRKRRRTKTCKKKEDVENQRMTHITVERNRRKQMNDYLAVIRSLMPSSYVQRGDQASIIGGAINFVKELEQLSQTLEARKDSQEQQLLPHENENGLSSSPLSDFFTNPQYSTRPTTTVKTDDQNRILSDNQCGGAAVADIEVTLVETHANLKIMIKRKPKQLLKMVVGVQSLRLTILHLNVTSTPDEMVLYSISVKIDDGCQLGTVDEIAAAVNQMLSKIQEQSN